MKLSLLALVTVASATAIGERDIVFEARNFTASCVPHSVMCFYSLNAFQPGTMDTLGYNCTASDVGPNRGVLPEIKGGTCLPSSRTFDVVHTEGGMNVTISVQVSRLSYTRGRHFIPNDQIQIIPGVTPTGDYTAYVGPKDFSLERIWD
ncbi:hypothetical protein B0H66DRAFT_596092 [Apodospora peruviana]|uniref:Hypersensitive response-inducing protein n=1 Tax=Apodospora peruviana TaxID=516989 RepID=A0AAE0HU01_9PEZI|nr:hypothetical protein B0H66DRAFT_596092 [Apodospora peruviana]